MIFIELVREAGDICNDPVVNTQFSNVGDVGLIPGQGTKVPHAAQCDPPSPKTKSRLSE